MPVNTVVHSADSIHPPSRGVSDLQGRPFSCHQFGQEDPVLQLTHTIVCVTVVCMQVDRLSITLDPDLGKAVRDAAGRTGTSVSAWLGAAAADRLRNDILGAALDEWEAADGPFSDTELDAAARVLGASRHRRRGAA